MSLPGFIPITNLSCFCTSLVIYTLAKENKRDEGESVETWLSSVIDKILLESGIRGVIVGSRIINVFRKKIYGLFSTFNRTAKRTGGKSKTKLMNEWDVGPKYKFTIYYNELDVVNVEQENRQLKGEKR